MRPLLERLAASHPRGHTTLLPPPTHLSLRDSRTLNLALPPPEPVGRAHLAVSRAGIRHEVPLTMERLGPGGARLLTATATLRGPAPDSRPAPDAPDTPDTPGLQLTDGIWRLTLVTTAPEGRVRRRGFPLSPEPAPPNETPLLPHAPDPSTGALIRLVRCPGGRAALQVDRPSPHAELLRFEPRPDGAVLHGRLIGAPPHGWQAEAVRRRDGAKAPAQLTWQGSEFTILLPLDGMLAAGPGQWVWGFRLLRPGHGRAHRELPLARRLTDVRDPAAAFPAPFRVCALPYGALARIRPHFTGSGAFAVTCLELTESR
ncbi:hypothetical protein [Streptomyces cavernicola]|uniref:Transferase n=1 Tax=Streptomyces cavernicola TaxID=3043613 RepID=A0ABT6SL22_9ACTN|nr:hypothetical protein [Streptomyces sp. B-S-A6]MDI3408895.1 hypothetical protein [Streptomyces sp. B-S-A6]